MKLYIIDNTRKMKKIKRIIEENYQIESKEDLKVKMTKNDCIVLSDEEGTLEGLEKLKNIIILVKDKNYKYIWKLATKYKTLDIIDVNQSEEYVAERIIERLNNYN